VHRRHGDWLTVGAIGELQGDALGSAVGAAVDPAPPTAKDNLSSRHGQLLSCWRV
jgi:hypothetical protein